MRRIAFMLAIVVLFAGSIATAGLLAQSFLIPSSLEKLPITHNPTFIGAYPFILGSGNVMQNGSAYSYVWLDAKQLETGDSFWAYPALNVHLGPWDQNFTAEINYTGSSYGSSDQWFNFSIFFPLLNEERNFSQLGITSTFARTSSPLNGNSDFFSQISNVVGSSDEFEFFFYVGNGDTPFPSLSHGPVH